jgi:hypothetical protein
LWEYTKLMRFSSPDMTDQAYLAAGLQSGTTFVYLQGPRLSAFYAFITSLRTSSHAWLPIHVLVETLLALLQRHEQSVAWTSHHELYVCFGYG